MNILLLGSGGREHAIALALAKSSRLDRLFIAPGNSGAAEVGEIVDLDIGSPAALAQFCAEERIGLVVVGPEQPLIGGVVDFLQGEGVPCFGPTRRAAMLEGSKGFTKDLCREFGIPTAAYARFTELEPALAYLRAQGAPIVVKADGLAAGKGVVVAQRLDEAEQAVRAMLGGEYGRSGAEVVIEECLQGEEVSLFALCDGERAVVCGVAQDHKRVGEGDTGPNTGGMGAYSPASALTPALEARAMDEIVRPTLAAMRARGTPFRGVLYAGLMLTQEGPKLIEYNVRFGDPEAQVILPRLEEDLVTLMESCAAGRLAERPLRFSPQTALTVVLAAKNYPGTPVTGGVIEGVEAAAATPGVTVIHAGTRRAGGRLVAAGGRVLGVTALAESVREAQARAYAAIGKISWADGFCRRDIGWREAAREAAAAP